MVGITIAKLLLARRRKVKMADTPKVTKEMVEGKKKPPNGYEIKDIKHKEYSFKNTKGNVVTVKAHTEHTLVPIKKAEKPVQEPAPELASEVEP